MMWLTWRQFRPQAVTAVAALAVFAIALAATGPHLASLYASSGVAGCHGDSCATLASDYLGSVSGVYTTLFMLGIAVVIVAPAVIGVFWGAPLVAREFETGAFRLAWTQSITRARWMASKLALPGLAAIAVTEGLSLMYGWWSAPIGQAARLATVSNFPLGMSPFGLLDFDTHGVVPVGYAAFGFAVGVTAGLLIRRAVPAMAVTLVIFAAVQVAMPLAIRPNLIPPDRMVTTIDSARLDFGGLTATVVPGQPGAWILSSRAVNAAGQTVSTVPASCMSAPSAGAKPPDPGQCMARLGIRETITYQPTSRFWPMQWTETAIYLALAAVLAGFCYWRVARRLP